MSPERGGPATCTRGFASGERMPLGPGPRAPIAVGNRFCGGGRGSWALYFAAVLNLNLEWTRCMVSGHEMACWEEECAFF